MTAPAGWAATGPSRHIFRNAAGEVRAMIRWTSDGWVTSTPSRDGWSVPVTLAGPGTSTVRARAIMESRLAMLPPTSGERQLIALALASPHRSMMPQADAGHLPLFVAANEPRLI